MRSGVSSCAGYIWQSLWCSRRTCIGCREFPCFPTSYWTCFEKALFVFNAKLSVCAQRWWPILCWQEENLRIDTLAEVPPGISKVSILPRPEISLCWSVGLQSLFLFISSFISNFENELIHPPSLCLAIMEYRWASKLQCLKVKQS